MNSVESEQFHIRIDHRESSSVTREADSSDSWDRNDVYYDHEIRGYEFVKEGRYWDFVVSEPPQPFTRYYVVYALYDTGDSFHREANRICFVYLTEHYPDAQAVMFALEKDYRQKYGTFEAVQVKLPVKGTIEPICSSTWKGHFERLRSIQIETVTQTGNGKNAVFFD